MTYWCPGCQAGDDPRARVTPRRAAPRPASLRVAARVLPRGVRSRAWRAGAVRVRGAHDARRPVALRVPPARARLRRGAGADAAPAARRTQRDRRPEARACGGDLRARALRDRRHRRRGALPLDPPADARRGRPSAAAASTGTTTRSTRAYADLEQTLFGTRAHLRRARAGGRALGRERRRPRRRHHASPGRRRRDLAALARGARA